MTKYVKRESLQSDLEYYYGLEGLFGIAFFGFKGTKAQKQKMRYIRDKLNKLYCGE